MANCIMILREHSRPFAAIFVLGAAFVSLLGSAQSAPRSAPSKPPLTTPATLQPLYKIQPPQPDYRFPQGMVLHYKAEWRLLNAGVATLEVRPGANGEMTVVGTADATGFVARLYHVHDVFQSAFGGKNFCSDVINKHTEEGFRRHEQNIRFDYSSGKSVRDDVDLKSGRRQQMQNAIPNCATDVLSGLIYAGSLPLQPGSTYFFPLNDGGQTANIQLVAEGREQLKTNAGTFNTVRVLPTSDSPLLKKRGKIWIWYSDDGQHIPVQMRGRMGWGTLTLTLDHIDRLPAGK
jgi:hypothetical protein